MVSTNFSRGTAGLPLPDGEREQAEFAARSETHLTKFLLCGLTAVAGFLQGRPNGLRRGRHGQIFRSDRIGDGVDHGGGRRDRAGLAATLDAERIARAPGGGGVDLEAREVLRA